MKKNVVFIPVRGPKLHICSFCKNWGTQDATACGKGWSVSVHSCQKKKCMGKAQTRARQFTYKNTLPSEKSK